jgi:hypothetical protein
MREKKGCRIVQRLIQTMPKGGCEDTIRQVSRHLSGCEECRKVHAEVQKMDEALVGSPTRFEEAARRSESGKIRMLSEIAESRPAKGIGRARLAWAGAGIAILALAGGAALYLFTGRKEQPSQHLLSFPPRVTHAMAVAARSEALQGLAETMCRHQAPSFELPYTPPTFASEALFPQLRAESTLQSEEIVRMIVQPRTISVHPEPFPVRREEK